MITPVDIQSKAFKSGIGYDKKDVDGFINEILENYEELYRSNVELKDKVNMLNDGLQHYKNIEASLQKALVLAEKTSEETIRTAELKAQTIEMEAVNNAKAHTADAKQELERVHNQTIALVQQYTKYKAQFTQFLHAQLDLINSDSFKVEAGEFAAFAKSAASAKDAYISSNPMADLIAEGEQSQLPGFDNGEDSGTLGQRDEADAFGMDFAPGSAVKPEKESSSFVDPFDVIKKKPEAAATEEPEVSSEQESDTDTYEGEVEDKVQKRAMLADSDEASTGFTFI